MIIGRQHLWSALDVGFVVTAAFIVFLLMITTVLTTELATGGMWPLKSFLQKIFGQESELFGYMVDFISTWGGLFYALLAPKCTLPSLLSFGIMFTLTSNLVLLSLRFGGCKRKKVVRRCRVRSCLWTRRKVFWLQKRLSRSAYVLHALQNSNKARTYCKKSARERAGEVSTRFFPNILQMSTLALIVAIAGSEI